MNRITRIMDMKNVLYGGFSLIVLVLLSACGAKNNNPGREYMPDMVHPISYKANYYDYYYYNRWGTPEEYHEMAQPRKPVEGTMPRGYIGIANSKNFTQRIIQMEAMKGYPMNSHVPFYYDDTDDDRKAATHEITENPFPITEARLKKGSELYEIYCGICHGSGADGDGYLVRDDGGKYPAAPTNLLTDEFIDTTAGAFYYTIMHGKNVMGSYASKLSYEDRWDVIHYIRSLQAKERDLEYTASANTLNEEAIPFDMVEEEIEKAREEFNKNGLYAHRQFGKIDVGPDDTEDDGGDENSDD